MTDLLQFVEEMYHPRLLRQNPDDINEEGVIAANSKSSEILQYVGRLGEYEILNRFRQGRYAVGARSIPKPDPVSGQAMEIGPEFATGLNYVDDELFYVKKGEASAISQGLF